MAPDYTNCDVRFEDLSKEFTLDHLGIGCHLIKAGNSAHSNRAAAVALRLPPLVRMSRADDLQARADAFADRCIAFVEALPPTLVAQRIGGQFLHALTSVAANYRAARRGRSYAEFTAKMGIVAEEADESAFWLARLLKSNIKTPIAIEPPLAEATELAKIFNAAARTARQRRSPAPK